MTLAYTMFQQTPTASTNITFVTTANRHARLYMTKKNRNGNGNHQTSTLRVMGCCRPTKPQAIPENTHIKLAGNKKNPVNTGFFLFKQFDIFNHLAYFSDLIGHKSSQHPISWIHWQIKITWVSDSYPYTSVIPSDICIN